jgi:GTP-binding protein
LEIKSVTFHRAAYSAKDFPRDGRAQFALVGRSNVGKSSLINTIFRRKDLARVSQTPGKTQAIHFYLVNEEFYVVDLPGYGYAKVPRAILNTWSALIESYFESADDLRLFFLLLDIRRVPSPDDERVLGWAREHGFRERVVLTKADKMSNNERAKSMRIISQSINVSSDDMILFSKVTREGVDRIWRDIDKSTRETVSSSS